MSLPPFGPLPQDGRREDGAIAQLGERLNGIQEVTGSIPVSSTRNLASLLRISEICANAVFVHRVCWRCVGVTSY
jgi:hypothetical protein